jgi:polyisoprenoid-binding protein YceI
MGETRTTAPAIRTVNGVELLAAGTWAIDVSHSSVTFKVKHLGLAKTRGRFTGFEGTVAIGEDPSNTRIEVTIDAASVDTHDEKRDGHLRSPDFFDVENHPKLSFRSTRVHGRDDEWKLEGELTVTGVTRAVSLDVGYEGVATDPWGGTRAGFTASGQVNREDFGLSWNASLEAGRFLVGKTVTIDLDVELVKEMHP